MAGAAARAKTAGKVKQLGDALAAGDIAGEHIDAVTAGLRDLTAQQQALLAGKGEQLALSAGSSTPDEFRRELFRAAEEQYAGVHPGLAVRKHVVGIEDHPTVVDVGDFEPFP